MVFNTRQLSNFLKKVDKTSNCWNWIGYTANGYGKVCIGGKVYFAHRISFYIHNRKIEPLKKELGARGQILMHLCDNRKCVNPNHLKISTQRENMLDAKNKGRKWNGEMSGEKNPKAKLKWSDVYKIRENTFSVRDFMKQYRNIDRSQYYSIKNFKSWIPA